MKEKRSVEWKLEIPIHKDNDAEQIVKGVVYEPDVVDSQGDYASADEIRKACHNFMMESSTLGVMHKEAAGDRASIVENYITDAPTKIGNQTVKAGTWVMAVKIHDPELWKAVQEGRITGFSMGGRGEEDLSA